MVLVSWGGQQVPPKGASKATVLWASTQALLGSHEWWLSLPECLPKGGPLGVKATLSPGLTSWTFCCRPANNCTKLAAHKNVPAKPLCHRQAHVLPPPHLRPGGWLTVGCYLSQDSADSPQAAGLPLGLSEGQGPGQPGVSSLGSAGPSDVPLLAHRGRECSGRRR